MRFPAQVPSIISVVLAVTACGGHSYSSPMLHDYQQPDPRLRITPQSFGCLPAKGPTSYTGCGGSGGGSTVCTISFQEAAYPPVDQQRQTIGVGEQVALSSPGDNWQITTDDNSNLTGQSASSPSGSSNNLIAGMTAGSATVTVTDDTGSCTSSSLTFTIISPYWLSYAGDTKLHKQGNADIGVLSNLYVGPDSVSFAGIYVREQQATFSANGPWACFDGQGHLAAYTAAPVGGDVPGSGSVVLGYQDRADSGYGCGGLQNANASETVNIPTQYSIFASDPWYGISTVTQTATVNTSGALTMDKYSAHSSGNISDGTTGPGE